MKLIGFGGKLAKGIFSFFIIASLLPLLVGSLTSYFYVKEIIKDHVAKDLKNTSKEHGQTIFFRLKQAKDSLANHSEILISQHNLLSAQNNLSSYYTAVGIYQADNHPQVLWGDIDDRLFRRMPTKNNTIIATSKNSQQQDIYIVLTNGVYGKINSKYLWSEINTSENTNICVKSTRNNNIYCKDNINSQENFLIGKWRLFMDHEFNIDDWIILSQKNHSESMVISNEYKLLFSALVSFSLLLVILLSSILIRKNLSSIKKLIDATTEISKNNFNIEIDIKENNEFKQLANSFNSMAQNLKAVNDEYKAFSDIENLILSSEEPRRIILAIFNNLKLITGKENFIFINHQKNIASFKRIYYQKKSDSILNSNDDELLNRKEIEQLHQKKITLLSSYNPPFDKIKTIVNTTEDYFLAIPIIHQNTVFSVIVIPIDEHAIEPFLENKLQNFSSRITTAFQALNRASTLTYRANYDLLTHIPNRTKIAEIYHRNTLTCSKSKGTFALLFLDLDRFKQVNDNYGHSTGDILLQTFTKRMQKLLNRDDEIARLGGDEFIIITPFMDGELLPHRIETLCNAIIQEVKKPFTIQNNTIYIGTSIGVSLTPEHGETFEDALKYADIAMYFSKKKDGNRYTLYDPSMSEQLLKKTLLEKDLRIAIENRNISLHYQPKVKAECHDIQGFEALFRWTHDSYGNISPLIAIEMAEDIGIIDKLGNLVFELALEQWQEWLSKGFDVGSVAINVSPAQLTHTNFVTFIKETLARFPLVKPEMIELEITESVVMEDAQSALSLLEQIRSLGFKVAIDDFGTGYSSLSYLLDIPADTLKIDRAFVLKIEQDENALALLSSLITLGKSMNYKIVAEGIETQQQAKFLAECKTDLLQGYLFSKPLPAELIEQRFLAPAPKVIKLAN